MPRMIRGPELLAAILDTEELIRILTNGLNVARVPPFRAFVVAKQGVYEGKVNSKGRVFYIREIDPRPATLWIPDHGYWEGRAVLRYAADLRSIPNSVKNQETESMWDKLLKMNPPPKFWRRP